jgi:hypothetical protein
MAEIYLGLVALSPLSSSRWGFPSTVKMGDQSWSSKSNQKVTDARTRRKEII